jgi:hypothetical protein
MWSQSAKFVHIELKTAAKVQIFCQFAKINEQIQSFYVKINYFKIANFRFAYGMILD